MKCMYHTPIQLSPLWWAGHRLACSLDHFQKLLPSTSSPHTLPTVVPPRLYWYEQASLWSINLTLWVNVGKCFSWRLAYHTLMISANQEDSALQVPQLGKHNYAQLQSSWTRNCDKQPTSGNSITYLCQLLRLSKSIGIGKWLICVAQVNHDNIWWEEVITLW